MCVNAKIKLSINNFHWISQNSIFQLQLLPIFNQTSVSVDLIDGHSHCSDLWKGSWVFPRPGYNYNLVTSPTASPRSPTQAFNITLEPDVADASLLIPIIENLFSWRHHSKRPEGLVLSHCRLTGSNYRRRGVRAGFRLARNRTSGFTISCCRSVDTAAGMSEDLVCTVGCDFK